MSEVRGGSPADTYRFAPAAPEEEHVFGACAPGWHTVGAYDDAVEEWIDFMDERGIDRVCCLLSGEQIDGADADTGRYSRSFGAENVQHVPVADHHLADAGKLERELFPFLDDAVANDERVVVHCLAGIGRTGHVLAAWLVHGRGYDPVDAIETVEQMGRAPAEAIESGNARRGELYELLANFV